MRNLRHVIPFLCCMGVFTACFASAESPTAQSSEGNAQNQTDPPGLKLITIGHGELPNGHLSAIRIYEVSDGSKGHGHK
jgi:hypothetical protein